MIVRVHSWLILAFVFLAGCTTPTRLPQIEAPETGGAVAQLLVATTREPVDDMLYRFGRERSAQTRYRAADIWVPEDRPAGHVVEPSRTVRPEREFALVEHEALADETAFLNALNARLAERPAGERAVFLMVHGYNTTYADGLYFVAQMSVDFGLNSVPVHFSWPSAGDLSLYLYDRDSAQFSRRQLADFLRLLTRSDAERIQLLGHSMGGLLVMDSLTLLSDQGDVDTLAAISPLLLASPDIDVDVFASQLLELEVRPDPFIVMVSNRDRALYISNVVRGGHPRVGEGARIDELTGEGLYVIDLSGIGDGQGNSNHTTFATSATLIELAETGALWRSFVNAGSNEPDLSLGGLSDLAASIIYLPARVAGER